MRTSIEEVMIMTIMIVTDREVITNVDKESEKSVDLGLEISWVDWAATRRRSPHISWLRSSFDNGF